MKRCKTKLALFLIGLSLLLTACQPKNEDKYTIVVTTNMIGEMVKSLTQGIDEVEIEVLMGPGVDPHTYAPTAGDVQKIYEAEMIFYSGLHLEGKMTEVFHKLEAENVGIHSVAEVLNEKDLLYEDGEIDPHVWWDAKLWAQTVRPAGETLKKNLPKYDKLIEENTQAYRETLIKTDEEVAKLIQSIPKDRRVLVTAHDAFNYYGRAYEIPVLSIQGLNTNAEAGAGHINELATTLAASEIPAIFPESSVSSKSVEVLLEASQGLGHKLHLGRELYSDSLGNENTEQGAYPGAILYNTEAIVAALMEQGS